MSFSGSVPLCIEMNAQPGFGSSFIHEPAHHNRNLEVVSH
jgi:hypothetical protein